MRSASPVNVGETAKRSCLRKSRKKRGPKSKGRSTAPWARALRQLMARLRLTITEIAYIAGVHPTAAARWLYGSRPRPERWARLQRAFGALAEVEIE